MTTDLRLIATEAPQFRTLAWRSHQTRVTAGEGVAFVEWSIEEQLARVLDEQPAAIALPMLAVWNPGLSVEHIESLLDLADEARDAEVHGPADRFHAAVDDYCDQLHRVALDVRACHVKAATR